MAELLETSDTVGETSQVYDNMALEWTKILDLRLGTRHMRSLGEKYLPKFEAESEKGFKVRVKRSFLYGAYSDTVRKLTAKPFSQKVELKNGPTEKMVEIEANVDRVGTDLTSFTAEVFEAGIDYGLTHILVDYPTIPEGATLEEEKAIGAFPTFIHVDPPKLIGWQAHGTGSGLKLTQIRILEEREEDNGDFSTIVVKYVRVYTETEWELWKAIDETGSGGGDQYQLINKGPNTLGFIPLVTIYFNKTGFMSGQPTLDELAWLNLWHWQSSSDQNNILSFARFGVWFMNGISEEEKEAGIEIGPNRLISSTGENADMKVVESTGASIEAGERDLRQTEQRMEVLGLQPLVQRSGVETATGKKTHENKQESMMQAWVRRTSDGMTKAYRYGAKWTQETLEEKFRVDIFRDFGVTMRSDVDMRILLDMRMAGNLTPETLLAEAKRRGLLSDDVDIKTEMGKLRELIDLFNEGLSGGSDGGGGDNNDTKITNDPTGDGPAVKTSNA